MSEEEKIKFLESHGWHTYYNDNYWVNPKTITNPNAQDYTNYGLSLEEAYAFETRSKKPK